MIKKRKDGTFEIIKNGYPYHVLKTDEPLYSETKAYAKEHPEEVEDEKEYVPSKEELALQEEARKRALYQDIDFRSIRPIRAILDKVATQKDWDALHGLEEEAKKIRGK